MDDIEEIERIYKQVCEECEREAERIRQTADCLHVPGPNYVKGILLLTDHKMAVSRYDGLVYVKIRFERALRIIKNMRQ